MPGQPMQPQRYRPDHDPLARLILYSILAFPLLVFAGEGLGTLLRLQAPTLYTTYLIGGWCAWLISLGAVQTVKKRAKQRQNISTMQQWDPRLSTQPPGQGEWQVLWGLLAASIFLVTCTDGYIFAIGSACALTVFLFTASLRARRITRLQRFLRFEWILLGYTFPFVALSSLIPLQVQWYPMAKNAIPHFGLHLFFPVVGLIVVSGAIEAYCLKRICRQQDARDEVHLRLVQHNRLQWVAWIAWRIGSVAGTVTAIVGLSGHALLDAYLPDSMAVYPMIVTAVSGVCFACMLIILACAALDLRRTH